MSVEPEQPRMEYLDAGPTGETVSDAPPPARRTRGWVPVVAGIVTFLVVLGVLGALVGDWTARNVEMRALVTQIESSEQAMGDLQAAVEGVFADYEGRAPLDDEARAALDAELSAAAEKGRVAIAEAGDRVAAVRWAAWHREVSDAQEAYLAHNRAWQDYLQRASEDPAQFGERQDAVNDTFEAAEQPLRSAVPWLDLFDLVERLDVVFAPAPVESGGPTQSA